MGYEAPKEYSNIKPCATLLTVYKNDRLEYFQQAVESIIKQSIGQKFIRIYLGIDGVISNEINEFIQKYKGYFYYIHRNATNLGLAKTLNILIDKLGNENFIFRMDADDISYHDRFEKQIEYLEKHPEIMLLGGSIEEFSNDSSQIKCRRYPKNSHAAVLYITKASPFAHPTVCFRRELFDLGFRYPERFRCNEDVAFWFELLRKRIGIANLDDVVIKLRITPNFYERRSYKKAFEEFLIYWNGIIHLHSLTWRLIFPLLRLTTRLLPKQIIRYLYAGNYRDWIR